MDLQVVKILIGIFNQIQDLDYGICAAWLKKFPPTSWNNLVIENILTSMLVIPNVFIDYILINNSARIKPIVVFISSKIHIV